MCVCIYKERERERDPNQMEKCFRRNILKGQKDKNTTNPDQTLVGK